MDFNNLIEEEIKNRVAEIKKKLKAEIKKEIDIEINSEIAKRVNEYKNNLKHTLIAKINEALEETSFQLTKCDFKECKNYGDGSIDDCCKDCSNLNDKSTTNKITENLKDSKAINNNESTKHYSAYENMFNKDHIKFSEIKDENLKTAIYQLLNKFGLI